MLMETEQFLGRFMFASRHEQKHRILWIRSKNDLWFLLKKCKILVVERWNDRARKVQPWYGLGTALVRSRINNIFFHLCEKSYFLDWIDQYSIIE